MRWVLGVLGALGLAGAAVVAVTAAGCRSGSAVPPSAVESSPPPVCAAGATQACACATAQNGAQVCDDDGRKWGECVCETPPKQEPAAPGELRVKRLVLVDDDGRERAVLEMGKGLPRGFDAETAKDGPETDRLDGPRITFADGAGRTGACLGMWKDASGLALYFGEGKPNTFFSRSTGGSDLSLSGPEGSGMTSLSIEEGEPSLRMIGGRGKAVGASMAIHDGEPSIGLLGAGGSARLSVAEEEASIGLLGASTGSAGLSIRNGEPSLDMFVLERLGSDALASLSLRKGAPALSLSGPGGTMAARIDALHGSPSLVVSDDKGAMRVSVGRTALVTTAGPQKGTEMTTPISSIVLFDDAGKVTWQAP